MVRLKAESSDSDVLVTAFRQQDGKATLVILNRSMSPVLPELNWHDMIFSSMEVTDPYHPNTIYDVNLIAECGQDSIEIQPGAIVTLTNVPLNRLPENFTVQY